MGGGIVAGVLFRLAIGFTFLLTGCASQKALKSPGVERTCTGWYCYMVASAETVNERCTNRRGAWKICQDNPNSPACMGAVAYWDSGEIRLAGDPTKRARCCTVLRPRSTTDNLRYWIWMSAGDTECLAHEHGHIEVFERDGFKYIPEHHKRLHNFGIDRSKRRL